MYDLIRNETLLVCDALKDVWRELEDPDVSPLGLPIAEVQRSIHSDGLDEKWQVDPEALCEKLFMLGETESRTFVAAVKQIWDHPEPVIDMALRASGLF